MPALALNGVTVPISSWKRGSPERLGDRGRGLSGAAHDSVHTRKWRGSGSLLPKTPAEAQAWRGLIAGRGDKWSFDASTYLSAWGRPHTLVSGVVSTSGAGPYGGSDRYLNATGSVTWTLPATTSWTLLATAYMCTPNWTRWLIRSDGRRYKAGTLYTPGSYDDLDWLTYSSSTGTLTVRGRTATATAWAAATVYAAGDIRKGVATEGIFQCTVGGLSGGAEPAWHRAAVGNLTVDNAATWAFVSMATVRISDMVWLPYAVPDSWVSSINTEHTARAWTLPHLRATGDVVESAPRTVDGAVTGAKGFPFMSSGSLEPAGEALDFELTEA